MPTRPMATVNYSVPDDVKQRFNETFAGCNKSAVVADLMRKAVEESERQARSAHAIDRILADRERRPVVTAEQIRVAREEGRP